MILRRYKRIRVPKTIWKGKGAPSAALDPKITENTVRTAQKTALKPIIAGPLPETIELDENDLPELPTYNPPLNLQLEASESLVIGLSKLIRFNNFLRLRLSVTAGLGSHVTHCHDRQDQQRSTTARSMPEAATSCATPDLRLLEVLGYPC
jgi:hypothetical protein